MSFTAALFGLLTYFIIARKVVDDANFRFELEMLRYYIAK